MHEAQKIAAVVLFKDLHSKKMDLYDVLAAFISDIIINKGLSKFSTVDMSHYLIDDYGFDSIPQNVIKIGIKRTGLTKLEGGYFAVDREKVAKKTDGIGESLEEEIVKNDNIIAGVCEYIEHKKGVKLSDSEKEIITRDFCAFLLDSKYENTYIAEIASYIISLDGTPAQERIEEITEGVYQYAALTYNEDVSKIEKLKNEMFIFLDTEALLSLGGFHGNVHKQYIAEMLQLISEINEKTKKRYISVKYMDYVKKELDDVFNSAIFYVQGKNYYSRDAVESIADGCKTEEDIMEKRANFFARLRAKGISEFSFSERYSDANKTFNFEGDPELRALISEDISEKDVEKGAKRVSDIHKLRKGMIYRNFEEIKYLFVSDNGKVQIVNAYYCKQLGCYNFIMGCAKLTNILWLKMNKGLSKMALPVSLKAVTRSRVVVSGFTSSKMKNEMKIINAKIETGELEREALYEMISDFKNYAKHPEDITADSVDLNLSYIESEMKIYGEELSMYKSEVEAEKDKRGTVENAFKQYSNMVEKRDALLKDKETKQSEWMMLNKKKSVGKWMCVGLKAVAVLACFAVLWLLAWIANKSVMVEWLANREWIFSATVTIVLLFIFIVRGEKIDGEGILILGRDKIRNCVYGHLGVSDDVLDACSFSLEGIDVEISEIELLMEEYKKQAESI